MLQSEETAQPQAKSRRQSRFEGIDPVLARSGSSATNWRLDSAEFVSSRAYPPFCQQLLSPIRIKFPVNGGSVGEESLGGCDFGSLLGSVTSVPLRVTRGGAWFLRNPLTLPFVGKLDAASKR